ncbi:MAG: DUF2007 domain-containing protein [Desulfomonilaceae bacterium]
MFCPRCGCEYREGFYECPDCRVSLVYDPPPQARPAVRKRELVTILETSDPALISVVKSVLESEDIWYMVQGEGMSNLFPGVLGYHPVTFQIDSEDEEKARELLREFGSEMWEGPIEP